LFQPAILIAILAFARQHGRNREFLVTMIFSVLLVILISAVLPAYGPPHAYGIATGWDEALTDLRQDAHVSYGYVGIVTFPSFHACVAVLFTLAMRGHLLALVTAALLNTVMLVSILPLGGHYLVDLIAGCAIAALAFWAAQAINDLWKTQPSPRAYPIA
jgi:membrane-associated phospholipid phosphatase